MSERDGGPAFPVLVPAVEGESDAIQWGGISVRDYFAAKAMHATLVVAMAGGEGSRAKETIRIVAEGAYAVADAMLKAREA